MCVGIPMRVLSQKGTEALCEGRNGRETIDMVLVGELCTGAWILAFNGRAVREIDESRARKTDDALNALEAVMNGVVPGEEAIEAGFGDIVRDGAASLSPDFLASLAKKGGPQG